MAKKGESLREKLKLLADIQSRRPAAYPFDASEILSMAEDYDTRLESIQKNRGLNNLGRSDAVATLAKETYGRLGAFAEKTLGGLTANIDSKRRLLLGAQPTPTDPTAALLQELKRQEIRRAFQGLDSLQAELLFLDATPEIRDALASGPPVVRRSPDGLPRAEPFVKPSTVDKVSIGEAEASNPSGAAEIRDLEGLRGKYEALVNMFKQELKKQTHEVLDEPVAALKKA